MRAAVSSTASPSMDVCFVVAPQPVRCDDDDDVITRKDGMKEVWVYWCGIVGWLFK